MGPDFWTTLNLLFHHTTANVAQENIILFGLWGLGTIWN